MYSLVVILKSRCNTGPPTDAVQGKVGKVIQNYESGVGPGTFVCPVPVNVKVSIYSDLPAS